LMFLGVFAAIFRPVYQGVLFLLGA
jgi:hypothetical protein